MKKKITNEYIRKSDVMFVSMPVEGMVTHDYAQGFADAIDAVLAIPPTHEQHVQHVESVGMRWIPCAERLPDENLWTGKRQCSRSVLMTVYCEEDEERISDFGHTVDGRWYSETIQKYVPDCWEVVAWCPLPEPWKEEK